MKWGQLHGFALDCLRYLKTTGPFDTMTVVDSDQLALKSGYSSFLAQRLNRSARVALPTALNFKLPDLSRFKLPQ